MIAMIDNYDSFTYNLVQYFGELGAELRVFRNDELSCDEVMRLAPSHIVISPGPGTPEQAGIVLALENHWGLTTRPENLLRIHQAVRSPWLRINLDTGNFPGEPYAGIEQLVASRELVGTLETTTSHPARSAAPSTVVRSALATPCRRASGATQSCSMATSSVGLRPKGLSLVTT